MEQIGRFKIQSQQGAGGMGVIYLGEDEKLGRKAAIKLLGPDRLNDPKAEARFKREATAAARLKHPNIAALYEMGEQDGKPFLAIEWVEGESLEELLGKGPIPLPRAMKIIEQVLSTLDYAHAHGVVHRDVKPANLMISGQDHVTLVDFGLAFLLSEPGLTSTGVLFGTPLYLAPEMAGEDDVDGRADLYSAALVLFEMLTGDPPFDPAPPAELISQHLHAPRPALTERRPDLPAALDPVLEKAMAVKREERYPTGAALWQALEQAVGTAPPPPKPQVLPYILAGVALLAIGLWAFSPRTLEPPVRVPIATVVPEASLPEDWEQPGGGPGRDYALSGLELEPIKRWTQPAVGANQMLVSESRLLVIGPRSVQALHAVDGKPIWQAKVGGRGLVYSWSEPSLVILQDGKTWRGLSTANGKEVWKAELPADGPGGVMADDEYLYLGAGQFLISLAPDTGAEQFRVDLGEKVVLPPVARKAGAFVATEKRVVAVDSFTERVTWSWPAPTPPTALAISPDDSLLVGCSRGELTCLPLLSGETFFEKELDTDSNDDPQAVAGIASVAGKAAVVGSAGEVIVYYTLSDSDPLWKLNLDTPPAGPPLTDGERVLVTTGKGELIAYKGGRESWKMELGGPCPTSPVPAGEWLFVLAGGAVTAYGPK